MGLLGAWKKALCLVIWLGEIQLFGLGFGYRSIEIAREETTTVEYKKKEAKSRRLEYGELHHLSEMQTPAYMRTGCR